MERGWQQTEKDKGVRESDRGAKAARTSHQLARLPTRQSQDLAFTVSSSTSSSHQSSESPVIQHHPRCCTATSGPLQHTSVGIQVTKDQVSVGVLQFSNALDPSQPSHLPNIVISATLVQDSGVNNENS